MPPPPTNKIDFHDISKIEVESVVQSLLSYSTILFIYDLMLQTYFKWLLWEIISKDMTALPTAHYGEIIIKTGV